MPKNAIDLGWLSGATPAQVVAALDAEARRLARGTRGRVARRARVEAEYPGIGLLLRRTQWAKNEDGRDESDDP